MVPLIIGTRRGRPTGRDAVTGWGPLRADADRGTRIARCWLSDKDRWAWVWSYYGWLAALCVLWILLRIFVLKGLVNCAYLWFVFSIVLIHALPCVNRLMLSLPNPSPNPVLVRCHFLGAELASGGGFYLLRRDVNDCSSDGMGTDWVSDGLDWVLMPGGGAS